MPELLTYFASAERASPEQVGAQAKHFRTHSLIGEILNFVPDMVLILNRERQIVYANRASLRAAGAREMPSVLGMRPGEMLHCLRCDELPGGCGTSLFCRYCGAANAILQSQAGKLSVEECRITTLRDGIEEAADLRVWGSPLRLDGEEFTFFVLANIADEKRREFLERAFLHDVRNTATALRGYAELMATQQSDPPSRERYGQQLASLAERIIREIEAHRQLVAAESGELRPEIGSISSLDIVTEVLAEYSQKELLNGRRIALSAGSPAVVFESDRTLLARVLGNMVINAIEASLPEQVVTLGCGATQDEVVFWVHNPGCMPESVRLQMFQRSFSTKGAGRGLGTYSMRYLTEKYLGGKISFTSTQDGGTTFTAVYPVHWAGKQLRRGSP